MSGGGNLLKSSKKIFVFRAKNLGDEQFSLEAGGLSCRWHTSDFSLFGNILR